MTNLESMTALGFPIPLSMIMNGQIPDSDDGKVIEITGDDVQPEMPPTPVNPSVSTPPERNPAYPTKPEGTGTDQRSRA